MDVTIIILNWNTCALLEQCLTALYQAPPVCTFDAWVVDNASTDDSVAMVRRGFPQVQVLSNTANLGFASANNQVLRRAGARYALLLNSDAILPPAGLDRLVAVLDARPHAAAVGPLYCNADGSFQASFADFPRLGNELLQLVGLARRLYGRYYPSHGPEASRLERQADWVPGACLLIRMAAVSAVGLLDEDFYFYSEEVDWCFRLRQRGWEVWYCPSVEVKHYLGQSARRSSEIALWNLYRGKLRFFAKHYGAVQTTILKWGLVLYLGVRSLAALLLTPSSWHDPLAWRVYWRLAGRMVAESGVIITPGKSPAC